MSIFLDYAKRAYNSIKHFSPLAIQRNLQELSNTVGDLCESVDKFYSSYHEPVIVNAATEVKILRQIDGVILFSIPHNYLPVLSFNALITIDNVKHSPGIIIEAPYVYSIYENAIKADSQIIIKRVYCEKR